MNETWISLGVFLALYAVVARQLWVSGNAKIRDARRNAARRQQEALEAMNARAYIATIRDEIERVRRGDLHLIGDVIRATFGSEAASL